MKPTILSILSVASIFVLIALAFSSISNTDKVRAFQFIDTAHSVAVSPTPALEKQSESSEQADSIREITSDEALDAKLGSVDFDCDGIKNRKDNCVLVYNADQKNSDGDSIGDACDPKLKTSKEFYSGCDSDNDGVLDDFDNCPYASNPNQKDANKNHIGDVCEETFPEKVSAKKKRVNRLKRKKNKS